MSTAIFWKNKINISKCLLKLLLSILMLKLDNAFHKWNGYTFRNCQICFSIPSEERSTLKGRNLLPFPFWKGDHSKRKEFAPKNVLPFHFWKRSTLKGKNLLPREANSFLLEQTPFQKEIELWKSKQEVTKWSPFWLVEKETGSHKSCHPYIKWQKNYQIYLVPLTLKELRKRYFKIDFPIFLRK